MAKSRTYLEREQLKDQHKWIVQHNLVRAEHVAAEKLREELRTYDFFLRALIIHDVLSIFDGTIQKVLKTWMRGLIVVVPLFVFLLATVPPAEPFTFGMDPREVWAGLLGAIYFVFIPMSLMPFYALSSSKTATNLLLSPLGFTLRWCYQDTRETPLVEWSQVVRATMWQQPQLIENLARVGKHVILELDVKDYSVNERFALDRACKSDYSLFSFGKEQAHLYVSLDAFTREHDREMFINVLCRQLSAEQLDSSVIEENKILIEKGGEGETEIRLPSGSAKLKEAKTYTNMWLDDMHSARRRSVGPLECGQKLQENRYVIIEKIATGGQAIVYRARDNQSFDDRIVVLKEFILPVSAGSQVRNRSFENVKNEADVLSSLDHPGIIKLQDYFVEDHRAYLALENVEGTTVRDHVIANGALNDASVGKIMRSLCSILKYLHDREPPIVHRDISPDNLMLTEDGTIKLLDFNVAQRMESNETKTVVGKHNYIAPEQFRGKPVPQSDLYSLGGTIYFMLTGEDPVPLSCSKFSATVQSSFENLVAKLTDTSLEKRFKNINEVIDELSLCTASEANDDPGKGGDDPGESLSLATSEKHTV